MSVNDGLLISKNRGINKILIKAETKELTDTMSMFLQLLIDYNETIKKGATEKRVYEDMLKAVIDEYKFRMFGNYND